MDQIAGGMDARPREYPEVPEWMLDQLLTAEEGLRAVTVDAAYALGNETRRGHQAPGTLGDVTIISADVTGATPDEIRAMDVIATIVGGDVSTGPIRRSAELLTRTVRVLDAASPSGGGGAGIVRHESLAL